MHQWCTDLFPINRSITGTGVRETLQYLKNLLPSLEIHSVPSGTKVFDWTVPEEWEITEGYVEDENGNRVIDFKENNLHVIGYSSPCDKWLTLEELSTKIYTLPNQETAIPYVTSYYNKDFGFCMRHADFLKLSSSKKYHAYIKSRHFQGVLNYGELFIPSTRDGFTEEVLLSTYICHPSMANNELSGPSVATAAALWLNDRVSRKYNYRIVYVPETIGSISFLSKNYKSLKETCVAGFNLTCIGDERGYSFLPSRNGQTLSDKVAEHVLRNLDHRFKTYSWKDRGSDERQYCSPGVDLPIASIMRSKYAEYAEYHTSLDNLENVVTPKGLAGGLKALIHSLEILESNSLYRAVVLCEPQLGKRGLYSNLSMRQTNLNDRLMIDILTWADGYHDLIDIADKCEVPAWTLLKPIERLVKEGLLVNVDKSQHY